MIDYYSGHGHAFEKGTEAGGPVGCVTLQAFPTNTSTWAEVGMQMLEDQTEIEDLTPDHSLDTEAASAAVDAFIQKTYSDDEQPFSDWPASDEDEMGSDAGTYLVVLHIYGA